MHACHVLYVSLKLCRVSGHPLAQNEIALHMFLQEPAINKAYTPGKVRGK